MNLKNFEKINIKTVIAYSNVSPYEILINLKKSRLWDQISPKSMSGKNFGKINIKFKMRKQQCTPVSDFSQFGELQFLRPNLLKNNLGWSIRTNST